MTIATGKRRKAREEALKALFFLDFSPLPPYEAMTLYCGNFAPGQVPDEFFKDIAYGVLENKAAIDEAIVRHSKNWKLARMSAVDRNVLRVAVYELLHRPDVPGPVVVNEAVELAKIYGSELSPGFVNGILDSILNDLHPKKK